VIALLYCLAFIHFIYIQYAVSIEDMYYPIWYNSQNNNFTTVFQEALLMKIAFIGLGTMGIPMAVNVAKKYDLIGYSRTKKDVPFPFASSYKTD